MDRIVLGVTVIREAPAAPAGKRIRLHDERVPGLFVEITDRGTKTFKYRRRIGRRVQMMTLGRFPELRIDQARRMALGYAGEFVSGGNPQERKRDARNELTLGELFDEYLVRHAKPHKKTWAQDENQFRLYLDEWRNRQLSQITPRDVQARHLFVHDAAGPYAANRMLALLHCLFAMADEWGYFAQPNPARKVKKFREKSRERFLQADELPRFFAAVEAEPNETIRDFVLMSLFTGARRANVLAMRWDQINLEAATWSIPDTKSGDPHTVPLVAPAIAVLQARHATANDSPWVFPGTGRTGHLVEVKATWARILERAGIADLRLHDLRRTLGSWQAATGANLAVIGKSLAHKNVSTTMVYSRLNIDPVRAAMERASAAILETKGPKK